MVQKKTISRVFFIGMLRIEQLTPLGHRVTHAFGDFYFGNERVDGTFPFDIVCAMEREVIVLNKLGLHARPAAEFVRAARDFKSVIHLHKGGEVYSASSILDVLTANLDCGSKMTIHAEGPDAEKALDKLSALLHSFKAQEEGE